MIKHKFYNFQPFATMNGDTLQFIQNDHMFLKPNFFQLFTSPKLQQNDNTKTMSSLHNEKTNGNAVFIRCKKVRFTKRMWNF